MAWSNQLIAQLVPLSDIFHYRGHIIQKHIAFLQKWISKAYNEIETLSWIWCFHKCKFTICYNHHWHMHSFRLMGDVIFEFIDVYVYVNSEVISCIHSLFWWKFYSRLLRCNKYSLLSTSKKLEYKLHQGQSAYVICCYWIPGLNLSIISSLPSNAWKQLLQTCSTCGMLLCCVLHVHFEFALDKHIWPILLQKLHMSVWGISNYRQLHYLFNSLVNRMFPGTGTFVRLRQYQSTNPEGYE